eukprot:gb/GEZN01009598.1/.p1 GENE.gb/GEZN01009598.1/~~gb/GEZN01009598.1/.p1  ORF type:complete len:340 (-),score=11.70 gb/GEZN01009598.1/:214-1233(-)
MSNSITPLTKTRSMMDGSNNETRWRSKWAAPDVYSSRHAIAGFGAGSINVLLLHPMDLVKIRLQVGQDQGVSLSRRGIIWTCKNLVQNEGFRGFYNGMSPNLVGNACAWGSYFFCYDFFKGKIQEYKGKQPLEYYHHLLAGALSGVLTTTLTNPFWVVKTRMCLYSPSQAGRPVYNNLSDGLYKIAKYEGVQGLYKGFGAGLLSIPHGAIQFATYAWAKSQVVLYHEGLGQIKEIEGKPMSNTHFSTVELICMAAFSKSVAAAMTYPQQVIRSRLQDFRMDVQYKGIIDCAARTYKAEGFRAFFNGLGMNLLKVTPQATFTFVLYEYILWAIEREAERN